jgi:hypothetical protein
VGQFEKEAHVIISSMTKPKRPRDVNELAKLVVDIAIGDVEDVDPNVDKDQTAVALGKKGGVVGSGEGGQSHCQTVSGNARRAANKRWEANQ